MLVSDVYRLDLTSDLRPAGEPRKFPPVSPWNHSPCWTSDGVEIFFSTRLGLGAPFERREATGAGRTRPVMVPGDGCWYPAISRRGRRLIYSSLTFDSNIWSVDLLPTGQPAGTPTPATTTTRVEAYPTYAPDGKRLSMISNRMGPLEVWVADRDGSNAAQVTSIGGPHINAPRWSPDGRYIAFTSSQLGQPEIYVVSPEGGAPIRVTPHAAQDVLPGWSHDGKWLYFASDRSGEQQVWKVQLGAGGPAGEPVQVTRHGGSAPRESPDGQFLYYAKGGLHNPSLWRRRVGSEHEEKVLESLTYSTNYAVTRHGIFFAPAPRRGESSTISFLRFATGKIEIVATTPKTIFVGLDAAVGPDGIARSVAWTQFDRKNADLMLVENFR
jgi:WD40 repeat protein